MFIQTTIVIALRWEGRAMGTGPCRDILARVVVDGLPPLGRPLDATTRGGGATLTLLAARARSSIEHAPANNTIHPPLFHADSRFFVESIGFSQLSANSLVARESERFSFSTRGFEIHRSYVLRGRDLRRGSRIYNEKLGLDRTVHSSTFYKYWNYEM